MRLLTEYFAAYNDRDMPAVARTLHFPDSTYEGTEPIGDVRTMIPTRMAADFRSWTLRD
jgi:hypothetical protein